MERSRYKYLITAAAVVLIAAGSMVYKACQPKPHIPTRAELDSIARIDSAALHVAVVKNVDCLPLYYAKQTGMADSMGLDLRLLSYDSNIDCDTASIFGHADACYVDVARAIVMSHEDSCQLHVFASIPTRLSLIVNRKRHITTLPALKECIMGLERHSAADYYSDLLLDSVHLDLESLYRAQINDQKMRFSMVCGNQIETALLTEPYASVARKLKHKVLWHSTDKMPEFQALAMSNDALKSEERVKQITLLKKIYNRAVDQIVDAPDTVALATILRDSFCLEENQLGIARSVKPVRLKDTNERALTMMRDWLAKRGRVGANYDVKGLTTNVVK